MFPLTCYSLLPFLCLLFASAESPGGFAQSSTPQNKTPVVAPPTATKQWTGDLDVLLKRQVIRVGVPYSKTLYYTVKGTQYGVAYEGGKAFEEYLNKKYRRQQQRNVKIYVIFVVTPRDKAIRNLNDGFLDVLIGDAIITPKRQKLIDFSDPTVNGINEIVVTGPNSPQLDSVEDLSGKEAFVRKTSSYWEHLERLNDRFQKEKKPAVKLRGVPEDLSDEDLLQMVNAGLLPTIVVKDFTAKLWSQLFTKLQVHSNMVVASGAALGWAVRKDSPKLLAIINEFVKTHRQGTAFGNKVLSEYTGSTYMLKEAVSPEGIKRFEQTEAEFRKYSDKYRLDYLLMMAEGYEESGLNQNARSSVGAIGIMQLMPETGAEMKVGDIHQEDANIHAGIKYFRSMMDRFYSSEPMDDLNKVLFTLAAYNCGPDRVRELRREAAAKGLNPNIWMNNVEVIAAARIGAETVNYVSNIYKYYVAYKLIAEQEERLRKAKESFEEKPS